MRSVFELNKQLKQEYCHSKKSIILLGGSGSVGQQTHDLCAAYPDLYEVRAIIAGKNAEEVIRQAHISRPEHIVMSDEAAAKLVADAISHLNIKVSYGIQSAKNVISLGYDIAVTAIPGIDGVELTFDAIRYCKSVAFANKETIVYAGDLLLEHAAEHGTAVIPIDSEHGAIFQILDGIEGTRVEQIILTASGGPLLNKSDIENVSIAEVLKHPTWNMGKKITVDSATLFNKALEVIEASYLFGRPIDEIRVVIHPESIVHGMVKLVDGSLLMHAGAPDMKLPISYALAWPYHSPYKNNLDLTKIGNLTFQEVDYERFPIFKLAIDAAMDCAESRVIMNYANELAVSLFLGGKIQFKDIYRFVRNALQKKYKVRLDQSNYFTSLRALCDEVSNSSSEFL